MIQYIGVCILAFLFHVRIVCTILGAVCAWIVGCIVTSRASEVGRNCTWRSVDGWSFHVFVAYATVNSYVPEIMSSSIVLLFLPFLVLEIPSNSL
jgi:hypothetical protein